MGPGILGFNKKYNVGYFWGLSHLVSVMIMILFDITDLYIWLCLWESTFSVCKLELYDFSCTNHAADLFQEEADSDSCPAKVWIDFNPNWVNHKQTAGTWMDGWMDAHFGPWVWPLCGNARRREREVGLSTGSSPIGNRKQAARIPAVLNVSSTSPPQ